MSIQSEPLFKTLKLIDNRLKERHTLKNMRMYMAYYWRVWRLAEKKYPETWDDTKGWSWRKELGRGWAKREYESTKRIRINNKRVEVFEEQRIPGF